LQVEVTAALIAGLTSLMVLGGGHLLSRLGAARDKKSQINSKYMNPLRLFAEEVYYRLYEIKDVPEAPSWLSQSIQHEGELSRQEDEWYIGNGCYLISSCYFTACLFATITRLRRDIPYLQLGRNADTELLRLTFRVSKAFLRDLGIFYVVQHTIGRQMYDEDRLLNYREFCHLLRKPEDRIWFSQLLSFYLDLGRRDARAWTRLDEALAAIWDLGDFVDRVVKGGRSIETRLISEGRLPPFSAVARRLRILTANRYPKSQNPSLNRPATLRVAAG
jgi:hypothetical protein